MSVKEDFCEAWKARFSTSNFPELDYLDGTPNQEQLESAFKSCQSRIEALKTELKHQEFISEFLWKLLHQDSSSERAQGIKTRLDKEHGSSPIQLSANTNGLDAIIPTGNYLLTMVTVPQWVSLTTLRLDPGLTATFEVRGA